MDFDLAARKYKEIKQEIEREEAALAEKLAPRKQLVADLEAWITLKAQEQGLVDVRTEVGLVYWATHTSATVAEPTVFTDFVKQQQAWELLDTRANKTAVKKYIEDNGQPPPGVNFSSRRVFNLRSAKPKEQ